VIRVAPSPEPANFHQNCRLRGNAWLAGDPNLQAKLPNHWRQFIPDLAAGFGNRCGYLVMWDMNGTVDHFLGGPAHRNLAYEWSNYRYAAGWVNSSKKLLNQRVLDPFRVRDEWFEIDLASLHLRATPAIPPTFRARAAYTLTRLRLDHGPRVIQQRQTYYGFYQAGQMPLGQLEIMAPLLATAVRREMLRTHLATNQPVSRAQAAQICQVTTAQIIPLLRAWRLAGHLVAQGHGRGVRYRL
jgi:hypothetical protein